MDSRLLTRLDEESGPAARRLCNALEALHRDVADHWAAAPDPEGEHADVLAQLATAAADAAFLAEGLRIAQRDLAVALNHDARARAPVR